MQAQVNSEPAIIIVMKKKFLIILSMAILSIVIVSILFINSDQPNSRPNGFNRIYKSIHLKIGIHKTSTFDLKEIAGAMNDAIIFSTINPGTLIVLSQGSGTIKTIEIRDRSLTKQNFVRTYGDGLFIFDGNRKAIYKFNLHGKFLDSVKVPGQIFTRAVVINNNIFLLKQFFDSLRDQHIAGYNAVTQTLTSNDSLTMINYDSGMAEESKFYLDEQTHNLIAVFNKKNSFQIIDSNLKLILSAHTIDTFSNPILKTKEARNQRSNLFNPVAPIIIYNKYSSVFNGKLYVFSKLKADNEPMSEFKKNCNIDIYDLKDGKYLGSFYLPKYNGIEISSFIVLDKKIVANFKNEIFTFNF